MNETVAYVGEGGSGKSFGFSRYLRGALIDDATVFSNLPVNAPVSRSEGRLLYYSDLYDLARQLTPILDKKDDIVIGIDEADRFINARNWKDTSDFFLWILGQDRHFGVSIVVTTRHILKLDIDFRRQLHYAIECRSLPWPLTRNVSRKAQKKGKTPHGVFRYKEFKGIEYAQWAESGDFERKKMPIPTYGGHFWQGWASITKRDREFFNSFEIIPAPYVICKDCGHIAMKKCGTCNAFVQIRPQSIKNEPTESH